MFEHGTLGDAGSQAYRREGGETTGEPEGRRARRWHEVHDRLYRAATELFLEQGFGATSVDAIAERADVARKTAFNHFPRKRDFISEWGVRRRRQVETKPGPADPEEVASRLRHWFDELARINTADRPLTRRMLEGWREAGGPFDKDSGALAAVFTRLVTEGEDRGVAISAIPPARLGTLLYCAYFGTLYDWIQGSDADEPFDLGDAFRSVLDVVIVTTHPTNDPTRRAPT